MSMECCASRATWRSTTPPAPPSSPGLTNVCSPAHQLTATYENLSATIAETISLSIRSALPHCSLIPTRLLPVVAAHIERVVDGDGPDPGRRAVGQPILAEW